MVSLCVLLSCVRYRPPRYWAPYKDPIPIKFKVPQLMFTSQDPFHKQLKKGNWYFKNTTVLNQMNENLDTKRVLRSQKWIGVLHKAGRRVFLQADNPEALWSRLTNLDLIKWIFSVLITVDLYRGGRALARLNWGVVARKGVGPGAWGCIQGRGEQVGL